jgi:hypothetical protein
MLTFKTIHDFTDNSDSFSTLSFRTIDGIANNLINPTFNTTGSDMIRIAAPNFTPGTTNTPIDGTNPREISDVVSSGPQAEAHDPTCLSATMDTWGHPAIPISQRAALFPCLASSRIQPTEIR